VIFENECAWKVARGVLTAPQLCILANSFYLLQNIGGRRGEDTAPYLANHK
jgi:hypothetical protein